MRADPARAPSPIITPRGVEREYRIPKSTQHYWRHHADSPSLLSWVFARWAI